MRKRFNIHVDIVVIVGFLGALLTLGALLSLLVLDSSIHSEFHLPLWLMIMLTCGVFLGIGSVIVRAITLMRSHRAYVESARRWAGGELSYRIMNPEMGPLFKLSDALNLMASAIQLREDTTRLHAQELAIQSERLATTGRLAAGVAHEINNPLGGILLYGNLLLENISDHDPQRETIQRIVDQAARAKEIVVGLLDFARQSPPRLAYHDLNKIVDEVLRLLERQPQLQAMHLRIELSNVPLWVHVDAVKIQQVLINIILNAIDAMREGGHLTVRTGFSEHKGYCRVAVSDNGCGIREEDMSHIFEPFFTTKDVGQGVGLGLAISYGIIKQHSGDIDVQSRLGLGSTFRVILPLALET